MQCDFDPSVHCLSHSGHWPSRIVVIVSMAGSIATCLMRCRFHVYVMCTRPSAVWMTAGYEYSPGSLSRTTAAPHVIPSGETATFRGERPFDVWLYTRRCRPSRSVSASVPALGFGSAVNATAVHVFPLSDDHVSNIRPERDRPRACSRPSLWIRILG